MRRRLGLTSATGNGLPAWFPHPAAGLPFRLVSATRGSYPLDHQVTTGGSRNAPRIESRGVYCVRYARVLPPSLIAYSMPAHSAMSAPELSSASASHALSWSAQLLALAAASRSRPNASHTSSRVPVVTLMSLRIVIM